MEKMKHFFMWLGFAEGSRDHDRTKLSLYTKNEMRLDLGNAAQRNTASQLFAELS